MKIGHLSKVTLSLTVGGGVNGSEDGLDPKRFDFIYGIGSDGLSPLERALEGRREKDEFVLEIKENDAVPFFQHLWIPELEALFRRGSPAFRIAVLSVREAEPREVIRALAEYARCGDQCCSC